MAHKARRGAGMAQRPFSPAHSPKLGRTLAISAMAAGGGAAAAAAGRGAPEAPEAVAALKMLFASPGRCRSGRLVLPRPWLRPFRTKPGQNAAPLERSPGKAPPLWNLADPASLALRGGAARRVTGQPWRWMMGLCGAFFFLGGGSCWGFRTRCQRNACF